MNFDDISAFDLERAVNLLPPGVASLLVLATAICLALVVHHFAFRFLSHLVSGRDLFWRSLVSRSRRPMRLAIMIVALGPASTVAPLSHGQARALGHVLLICFIALSAWVARTALHIWTTVYLRRFKLDAEDNLLARKHVTQTRILSWVANAVIVTVAVSAALMTFEGVRQYGVSLLASAGAAGLVVGLALQPMLKNLFAGIQLAVTQPIRLDDAVLVEGEWGNVEEITATYVVIRIWDLRRLILPLSYFMEHPFQNWTRESASLIGTVTIYLDYAVSIDALRAKVEEIAAASPLWDGKVVNVQVTDFKRDVMEVRILVSASNSARAFDLRCEVREKLAAFLMAEYPHAVPRKRTDLVAVPDAVAARALSRRSEAA
jgi:small-conductance mechanosensitive channel